MSLIVPSREIIKPVPMPAIIRSPGLICPPRFRAPCKQATVIQPMRRGSSPSGPTEPFSLTETDTDLDETDLTTYTFTGIALGDDVSGADVRYTVIVACDVYVGGQTTGFISGTVASQALSSPANTGVRNHHTTILIADTSGQGTSGTVSITFNAEARACAIAVYRMINPSSSTPYDTTIDKTPSSGLLDLSLNIPTDGKAVAGVTGINAGTAITWTGLTESFDVNFINDEPGSAAYGGSSGTPHTVTAQSNDTTPAEMWGVSASWGP